MFIYVYLCFKRINNKKHVTTNMTYLNEKSQSILSKWSNLNESERFKQESSEFSWDFSPSLITSDTDWRVSPDVKKTYNHEQYYIRTLDIFNSTVKAKCFLRVTAGEESGQNYGTFSILLEDSAANEIAEFVNDGFSVDLSMGDVYDKYSDPAGKPDRFEIESVHMDQHDLNTGDMQIDLLKPELSVNKAKIYNFCVMLMRYVLVNR